MNLISNESYKKATAYRGLSNAIRFIWIKTSPKKLWLIKFGYHSQLVDG